MWFVFWGTEDEFCVLANETTSPWVGKQYGFATTEMSQMSLVALFSTFFNIWVLLFHWTRPPHPKFLLRSPRKLSIRLHVLSGTTEIICWVLAWMWGLGGYGQDTWQMRDLFSAIQCIASLVHLSTAAYQTPIVFGTQAVMIPAYVGCITAKLGCTIDLWNNLHCAKKSVRLYNVLSIYTWCRVFIALFGRTVMFQDSLYSVSILFAGAVCLPSMGPGLMCIAFLTIGTYQLSVHWFASDHVKAAHFTEHGRDLFDTGAFDSMISAALECPFADVSELDGKDKLRAVFDAIDTNKDGVVDKKELEGLALLGHSASWLNALHTYQDQTGQSILDFNDFCRVLGTKEVLADGDDIGTTVSLADVTDPTASFDTKAQFLFERMNHWTSEPTADGVVHQTLKLHDLAYILSQYGIPPSEAKQAMRKFDTSGDGQLDIHEFKEGFRPLIEFQVEELTTRMEEIRRSNVRRLLERERSKKAVDQVTATDRVANLIDDTMDAVGKRLQDSTDMVGGAALQVSAQAFKSVDKTAEFVGETAMKVGTTAIGGAKKAGTTAFSGATTLVDSSFKVLKSTADTVFGAVEVNRVGVTTAEKIAAVDRDGDDVTSANEVRGATAGETPDSALGLPRPVPPVTPIANIEGSQIRTCPQLPPLVPTPPRRQVSQAAFSAQLARSWVSKRQEQKQEHKTQETSQRIGVGR